MYTGKLSKSTIEDSLTKGYENSKILRTNLVLIKKSLSMAGHH